MRCPRALYCRASSCREFADAANVVALRLEGVEMKPCSVQVLGGLPKDVPEAPEIPTVQGKQLLGGPQMLQLS